MAGSLYDRLGRLEDKVRGYVPFTRLNVGWRFLEVRYLTKAYKREISIFKETRIRYTQ